MTKGKWWAALCLGLWALSAQAQNAPGKEDAGGGKSVYEAGFHLGYLLPNQIAGVTEIMGLGGVRGGFRFAPGTYAEGGLIMGNGGGAEWKNLHLDVRMDVPVENLIGLVYAGVDTIMYKGIGGASHMVFGGHVGGGLQTLISGQLSFRGDMKFGLSPGTSLYLGFGLVLKY